MRRCSGDISSSLENNEGNNNDEDTSLRFAKVFHLFNISNILNHLLKRIIVSALKRSTRKNASHLMTTLKSVRIFLTQS